MHLASRPRGMPCHLRSLLSLDLPAHKLAQGTVVPVDLVEARKLMAWENTMPCRVHGMGRVPEELFSRLTERRFFRYVLSPHGLLSFASDWGFTSNSQDSGQDPFPLVDRETRGLEEASTTSE